MDASQLIFGIKDVVAIVIGVISILGFLYALKLAVSNVNQRIETQDKTITDMRKEIDEKLVHEKNSKKAHKIELLAEINKTREELKEKEEKIYERIAESKQEYKDDHAKLAAKMDSLALQVSTLNSNISELTGYLKGKEGKGK